LVEKNLGRNKREKLLSLRVPGFELDPGAGRNEKLTGIRKGFLCCSVFSEYDLSLGLRYRW